MTTLWHRWLWSALLVFQLVALAPAQAAPEAKQQGRLVNAAWLQRHRADVVLLDASSTPQHRAGHIAGAVGADLYRYGPDLPTPAAMQQRIRSWGVSPGRKTVLYDQGGDMMATRLFFDLHYHGVPAEDIFILDGGLAAWRAAGGEITKDPTPAPSPGSHSVAQVREELRARLPDFLVASGDRAGHVLVDALEPGYYFGAQRFFDRAGHVPGAVSMPSADFFNADKTFKSPQEIRSLARYWGIKPEQVVLSHCGGGVAASVPWFALQFLAGHAKTKIYLESQHEWLRDDRGLPFWTYGASQLRRDAAWLAGWNAPMMRMFGVARLNIVDVRSEPQHAQGHVPFALNIPAQTFRSLLGNPEQLAQRLGPAGVNPAHEIVIVSEGGLTPDAALAFLALEQLGHAKVSVLMGSAEDWGLRGLELTKQPTTVGAPSSPKDMAVPAATYRAQPRAGLLISDPQAARSDFPRVLVASGKAPPTRMPQGAQQGVLLHLSHADLIEADGTPKPAPELWKLMAKAGVPRHAEIVLVADDVADAAVNYYLFRLMGWPDVKVWQGP